MDRGYLTGGNSKIAEACYNVFDCFAPQGIIKYNPVSNNWSILSSSSPLGKYAGGTFSNYCEFGYVSTGVTESNGVKSLNFSNYKVDGILDVNHISGPSLVCDSFNSTYTLNVPTSGFVTWSTSSNMTIVSGQGTMAVVVRALSYSNGSGWIKATLNNSCGFYFFPQKNIYVGRPLAPGSVSGASSPTVGGIYTYSASSSAQGASSHTWYLPYGGSIPWSIYGTANTLNVKCNVGTSYGYVQAMGVNACGIGGASTKYVTPNGSGSGGGGSGGGGIPRVSSEAPEQSTNEIKEQLNEPVDHIDGSPSPYPNPAINEIVVEFTHTKSEELVSNFIKNNNLESSAFPYLEDPIEYTLLNLFGVSVIQVASKDTHFMLDVSDVSSGTYILVIKYGHLALEKHKVLITK